MIISSCHLRICPVSLKRKANGPVCLSSQTSASLTQVQKETKHVVAHKRYVCFVFYNVLEHMYFYDSHHLLIVALLVTTGGFDSV